MINVFQLSWYAMEKRLATTRPDDIEIMADMDMVETHSIIGDN